jgi:hypothetical protein
MDIRDQLAIPNNENTSEILKSLIEGLEILSKEFQNSPLFDGEIIDTNPTFPDLSDSKFENIINAQITKLIPFLLKVFYQSLDKPDDETAIGIPDDISFLITSPEVLGDKSLTMKDFYRASAEGIVFSLRYQGEICKRITFGPDGKCISISNYFYTETYLFEYRMDSNGETRVEVFANDDTILENDSVKSNTSAFITRVSPLGEVATLIRRVFSLGDEDVFEVMCVEEIYDIQNPKARRIKLMDIYSQEELMCMKVFYSSEFKSYIAVGESHTMSINDDLNDSSLILTRTIKVLDDLLSDETTDLVKGRIGHAITHRSIVTRDNVTKHSKHIFYASSELEWSTLEIFLEDGYPNCIKYGNVFYGVSHIKSPKDNQYILFIGSKDRYVKYSLESGQPSKVKIVGLSANPTYKNPKKDEVLH